MIKIKTKINRILLNEKNITRSTFIWNAFSAVMNSFQTMVLLLIITRSGDMNDSSIFVMAYAVGNLLLHIGKYGVRQFQVTDVNEKYSLKDYVKARIVSVTLMLLMMIVYTGSNIVLGKYNFEKAVVILLICVMKAVEAYEDVYHGRMQQKGRLDTAGRILGIRLAVFIIGFAILYLITGNLVFTCVMNLMITIVLAIILNRSVMETFYDNSGVCVHADSNRQRAVQTAGWKTVLVECFPLCLCMCLNMYIANAPKYTIDTAVSDEVQTCFNIVFMPVFIIALLATFIFQPYLKKIGELWIEEKISRLISYIIRLSAVVLVLDVLVTIVGGLIGGDILGLIYSVDLKDFNTELILFMIAGGIIALQNLFIMIITTVRYQKYMIYGYIVTAVCMLAGGRKILADYGLTKLCVFFLVMLFMLTVYCTVLMVTAIGKKRKIIQQESA